MTSGWKNFAGHSGLKATYIDDIIYTKPSVLVPSVLWRCWLGGRKGIRPVKNEWWGVGVVVCLEWGAGLHMAQLIHCHSLSLAPIKSRLVLPFWYRLTQVVLEKRPLNGCSIYTKQCSIVCVEDFFATVNTDARTMLFHISFIVCIYYWNRMSKIKEFLVFEISHKCFFIQR